MLVVLRLVKQKVRIMTTSTYFENEDRVSSGSRIVDPTVMALSAPAGDDKHAF